jgi:hypothetical protein
MPRVSNGSYAARTLNRDRVSRTPGDGLHPAERPGHGQPHRLLTRFVPPNELMKDNVEHRVLTLMNESGFSDARRVGYGRMLVGRTAYYRASSPLAD